jgi:hypothetical protein
LRLDDFQDKMFSAGLAASVISLKPFFIAFLDISLEV